jgi:hypothetical protein
LLLTVVVGVVLEVALAALFAVTIAAAASTVVVRVAHQMRGGGYP